MSLSCSVLAISWALPPSAYPQSVQIGRLLYKLPHEVVAVSDSPADSDAQMDCYRDFSRRMRNHLQIGFRPCLPGKIHNLARKFVSLYGRAPDDLRPWITAAEKAITSAFSDLQREFSIIASFGEPMSDHLLALRLKKRTGLPWLAHFSDPWYDNPFRKPFVSANFINKSLERRVITKADRVVFTSEETRSLVMRKYPTEFSLKTAVLPHSFDPELYPKSAPNNDHITVRYLGTFYAKRSPMPVLRALQHILRETPAVLEKVRFEFIGGVAPRFLQAARRLDLPEDLVKFFPSVGYAQSMRLMVESDLLLVVDAPAKESVFLPSKLVDYLGARVPVLGIVPPGSSAKLVCEMGGIVADPSHPDLITKAITRALAECRSRRAERTGGWGDEKVRSRYSVENVGKNFLLLLQETAAVGG